MADTKRTAAEAYRLMLQGVNPLPAWAALDMVQETGVERGDAVKALVVEFVRRLALDQPERGGRNTSETLAKWVRWKTEDGQHDDAQHARRRLAGHNTAVMQDRTTEMPAFVLAAKWLRWADRAARDIELCRAIVEAA